VINALNNIRPRSLTVPSILSRFFTIMTDSSSSPPLHRIGLIADVQYVDDDDAYNYNKTRLRQYRQSLEHMRSAVDHWREVDKVDRVIQLGDLIDGKSFNQGKRDKDFATLRYLISTLPVPWHHCIGNHELYNFSESELREWISEDSGVDLDENRNYYAFPPCDGYLVVVLNSYQINDVRQSVKGNAVDTQSSDDSSLHLRMNEAHSLLNANNANADKNSPTGLEGVERRWCAFNGGLGKEQLDWFHRKMNEARSQGLKVIIS